MSAPPFALRFVPSARTTIEKLDSVKIKRVQKTLLQLRSHGPRYPGLNSRPYHSEIAGYTNVWESYVENRTPGAWRIWWFFGPEADTITIVAVGPHP